MKKLMNHVRSALTVGLVLSTSFVWADGATFKNPWSVVEKAATTGNAQKTFQCAMPPALSANMTLATGRYSDDKGSIRDEAKSKLVEQISSDVKKANAAVVRMVNDYQRTGNMAEGACVVQWLKSFARDGVLIGKVEGFQAKFYQAWELSSFALVWLKVQANENVSAEDKELINQWLGNMADQTKTYFSTHKNIVNKIGNMHYWAGLGVMAAGISLKRQDYFDWGVGRYKAGLDQVSKDGFLPRELARGQRARLYHVFALQPLSTMAELAAVNGVNLYSYNNYALLRLSTATVESLSNPDKIASLAKVAQVPNQEEKPNLGWLEPISKRFPSPIFDNALKQYSNRSFATLGGNPVPCCVTLNSMDGL